MATNDIQPQPGPSAAPLQQPARTVSIKGRLFPIEQPENLSEADAIWIVRALAEDTANVFLIRYGKKRASERQINRRQIDLCVQRGTPIEGPFLNQHGNWQMNLWRHAAGEELTCVIAIEWVTRILVVNTF